MSTPEEDKKIRIALPASYKKKNWRMTLLPELSLETGLSFIPACSRPSTASFDSLTASYVCSADSLTGSSLANWLVGRPD